MFDVPGADTKDIRTDALDVITQNTAKISEARLTHSPSFGW